MSLSVRAVEALEPEERKVVIGALIHYYLMEYCFCGGGECTCLTDLLSPDEPSRVYRHYVEPEVSDSLPASITESLQEMRDLLDEAVERVSKE